MGEGYEINTESSLMDFRLRRQMSCVSGYKYLQREHKVALTIQRETLSLDCPGTSSLLSQCVDITSEYSPRTHQFLGKSLGRTGEGILVAFLWNKFLAFYANIT